MSSLQVPVATIDDIRPHSNADNLELVTVLGWQCVTRKGNWCVGDVCIYFPPDTVLPSEWTDHFGVTQYTSSGRIRSVKLRGEVSHGLVVARGDVEAPTGTNVAGHFGATRYEPPTRPQQGQNRSGGRQDNPKFSRYTDIENLRHYPDAFYESEPVVVTEKIHGANVRVGIVDGEIVAGSRRLQRDRSRADGDTSYDDMTYWTPWIGYRGVRHLLESCLVPQTWWQMLLRRPRTSTHDVILFGEVYGPSIQSFDYGLGAQSLDFRAFDLMIDGEYVNYDYFRSTCCAYDIPMVPHLYRGSYDLGLIRLLSEGPSLIAGARHMREGVVVRPEKEGRDPRFGRRVLKYVSDSYLLKDKTDYTEE